MKDFYNVVLLPSLYEMYTSQELFPASALKESFLLFVDVLDEGLL